MKIYKENKIALLCYRRKVVRRLLSLFGERYFGVKLTLELNHMSFGQFYKR